MSTVVRPRGPLPRRVYWLRRALAAVVTLVVLAVGWWLIPHGPGDGGAPADLAAGTTTRTPTTTMPTTPASRPPTTRASTTAPTTHRGSSEPPTTEPPQSQPPATRPPSRPTGPCSPAVVRLALSAGSAPPGEGTTVRYRMWTTDGSTCRLGITPALMETKIYSAAGTAWQSSMCPDELAAKNVVVRPEPESLYSFHWDGHLRAGACMVTGELAPPASYTVAAALIGGEPQTGSFFVTEPSVPLR